MSAETTPAQGFPTPCTRCGGVLYQHVDFCPYCGVDHPLEKVPHRRADTALRAVETHASHPPVLTTDEPDIPPLESSEMPIPQLSLQQPFWQTAGRWLFTKGLVLFVFVLALGYAGYLLLGTSPRQEGSTEEASTNSAGGSISPYTPPTGASVPSTTITTVPVRPVAPALPLASTAPPAPRPVQHYKDVAGSLQAARTNLAQNNLAAAKAAVADALSLQSDNADALSMQSDIKDRENRRDVALGVANTCARDKLWTCVRDRAAQALALDVSSDDAQSLLERVILTTGWKASASAVQAPPAAIAPAVTAPPPNNTANAVANNPGNTPPNSAASGVNPPGGANSIDAQMRAIRESGWKHAPSAGAANKQ